ncbi:hypothetical protein D3C71_151660 [compost metagenome]
MKNPVLPCFLLLCMAVSSTAQRYQGVSIQNSKAKQHKESRSWTHEVQLALKFPNARGVSRSLWLSKYNMSDYRIFPTGASLAYYTSPRRKYSVGIELYYDVNECAAISRNMVYSVRKDMVSGLLQFRYYWNEPGDPGNKDYRLYSGVGFGASTVQLTTRGSYNDYPPEEEFVDWKYKGTLQYQAVVLGMVGGLGDFRFIGELGYGTMFIVKAGVNYRFPLK